jgi:hypothetical protein
MVVCYIHHCFHSIEYVQNIKKAEKNTKCNPNGPNVPFPNPNIVPIKTIVFVTTNGGPLLWHGW